jgi:hypothetical protein
MDLICSFSLLLLRDNDDDLMEAEEEDGRRPFSGVLMIFDPLGHVLIVPHETHQRVVGFIHLVHYMTAGAFIGTRSTIIITTTTHYYTWLVMRGGSRTCHRRGVGKVNVGPGFGMVE